VRAGGGLSRMPIPNSVFAMLDMKPLTAKNVPA
jgi:hypothetical protein